MWKLVDADLMGKGLLSLDTRRVREIEFVNESATQIHPMAMRKVGRFPCSEFAFSNA
jgi:hypothetical protein